MLNISQTKNWCNICYNVIFFLWEIKDIPFKQFYEWEKDGDTSHTYSFISLCTDHLIQKIIILLYDNLFLSKFINSNTMHRHAICLNTEWYLCIHYVFNITEKTHSTFFYTSTYLNQFLQDHYVE